MNGYEKYKNTCTSVYFAWTRSNIYKDMPKGLILKCIGFLKIDLRGNQSFPMLTQNIMNEYNALEEVVHIDPDAFHINIPRDNKYCLNWCYTILDLKSDVVRSSFVRSCSTCLAPVRFIPRTEVQIGRMSTHHSVCVHGHEDDDFYANLKNVNWQKFII
jgi:hypothetical protein